MRQRNPGPYSLTLPTLEPPVEVQEGEVVDHPKLLAGFEPIDPEVLGSAETHEEIARVRPAMPEQPKPVADGPTDTAVTTEKPKSTRRSGRRGDEVPEMTT